MSAQDHPVEAPRFGAVAPKASFFFALFYLVAEYMRPQSMYDSIASIPFGQIAILGLLFTFVLEGRDRRNENGINKLLVAYLAWFFFAYVDSVRPELAWDALIDFSKWVVIYFLLINTVNTRAKLYFFILMFLLLNFKYSQYATRIWVSNGFYSDPRGLNAGGGIGSGFFQNPNDFGIAMTSVLGISYAMIAGDTKKILGRFKMRWFHFICAASILIAVVASSSRGAALGAAVAALMIWLKGNRKVAGVVALTLLSLIVLALIPDDNWERFRAMGTEEDSSGQSRLSLWSAGIRMALENPLSGVGPNNFVFVNTQHYMSIYTVVQHNVFIQAASELGFPGLALFCAMIFVAFRNHAATRRILRERRIDDPFLRHLSHGLDICLVAFCVNGFFITVLYYPFVWMLFILSAALKDVAQNMAPQGLTQITEPLKSEEDLWQQNNDGSLHSRTNNPIGDAPRS